jgi:hypothetical protein
MSYGYEDPTDGWRSSEPDPASRGRRRAPADDADDAWQSERAGRQGQVPEAGGQYGYPASPPDRVWSGSGGRDYPPPPSGRPSIPDSGYGEPPTDRGWGAAPAERPYDAPSTESRGWGDPPPPRRPTGPQGPREDSAYARRPDGPAVGYPDERGWDGPRPAGRPPQAWQTDLQAERARRGYGEPPHQRRGPEDYRGGEYRSGAPARAGVYGAPAPADPRTRPGTVYPPRPRPGDDYVGGRGIDLDRSDDEPAPRGPWLKVLAVLATVALLAVCGAGFYITFLGKKGSDGAGGPTVHDITSRTIDPAPLTVAEVFPAATINLTGGDGGASTAPSSSGSAAASGAVQPYQVVKAEAGECKTAAVGDLATLLEGGGCSQVVRATLLTADQQYVVTTGLFNLKDEATTKQVKEGVKDIVNATKGRFSGFMAGGATDVIGRAKTQLAWDSRGHFLIYCVIARVDAAEPDARSPVVTQMVTDLVESYLNETVLTNRTLTPPPVPSAANSAAPTGSKK